MCLATGNHSSTLFFGSLLTTATEVKIEVLKFTVMFMQIIVLGLFSLSTYSFFSGMFHLKFVYFNIFVIVDDSLFVENRHELFLGNVFGNVVSLHRL